MPSETRPDRLIEIARRRRDEAERDLAPPGWIPPYIASSPGGGRLPVLGRIVYYDLRLNVAAIAPLFPDVNPRDPAVWADENAALFFAAITPTTVKFGFLPVGSGAAYGECASWEPHANCKIGVIRVHPNVGAEPDDLEFKFFPPCPQRVAAADPTQGVETAYGAAGTSCTNPDPLMQGGNSVPLADPAGIASGAPDPYITGACDVGGACMEVSPQACARGGGTYSGDGTSCP